MIIRCPCCEERISNKNKACPECRYDISGEGHGLTLEEASARLARNKGARVQSYSLAATGVVAAGVLWMGFDSAWFTSRPSDWSMGVTITAALIYIFLRLYMVLLRIRN